MLLRLCRVGRVLVIVMAWLSLSVLHMVILSSDSRETRSSRLVHHKMKACHLPEQATKDNLVIWQTLWIRADTLELL